ncbi:MAG: M56 family metallopeptidase [Synergistaceae bacterium]|nr:M56 family metallopeptidase [Synergistaceae bacterium]
MHSFIVTLLICSFTMSALALVYMVATPLLAKRYSVKWCYYTWLVVLIGLIIPFRPQWSSPIIRVDVPFEMSAPVIRIGDQIITGQIENSYPVLAPLAAEKIALAGENAALATENAALATGNVAVPSVLQSVSWWKIAAAVWLAGLIVFLAYHVMKYYSFAKMARRWSEKITDSETLALLRKLKAEMGISKEIGLYQYPCIGTPMMIGFADPIILLPEHGFSQSELRFILKHELVHYKRKDLYYKCLVLAATAIHWFNPIIYMIAQAIDVQCELSCDAETVRSADSGTRRHYTETIIGCVKYKSNLKTALSTNFNRGPNGIRKRIFSIMDAGNKKAGVAIFCAALVVTLGTGLAACYGSPYSSATVGGVIQLGGIDWRVLEVKDGKALILSEKILSKGPYNLPQDDQRPHKYGKIYSFEKFFTAWQNEPVTWEECSLRQYLNGEFYDSAFSNEEKGRIVETKLKNNDNPWYGMAGGNDTTDKVFLLSLEEVALYFGDSGGLKNRPDGADSLKDQFNEKRIAKTQDGKDWRWLLRSPGAFQRMCETNHVYVACVAADGDIFVIGDYVTNVHGGIRPALWLTL